MEAITVQRSGFHMSMAKAIGTGARLGEPVAEVTPLPFLPPGY